MNLSKSTKLWIGVTLAGAVILVICRFIGLAVPGAVAKLTASTAFIATAVSVGAARWTYGRIMLVGLVLSWFGDAFLIGSSEPLFLLGLVSFLLARVAYCVAFGIRGVRATWAAGSLVAVAAVSIGAMAWLDPHVPAVLAILIGVNTAVISLMVVLAVGARGAGATMLIPVGAVLFYFSDLSASASQFVIPDFPNYVWGLPFYFGGQVLLALSARPTEEKCTQIPNGDG